MSNKILIATGLYPPESGGPATYTKLLEERLPSKGIDVVIAPFREVRLLPKVVRHSAYFFMCLRRARGAQIIFAQDTVSVGLPALLAALVLRKKFAVRVPGDYAWEQARARFRITDAIEEFQSRRYGLRIEFLRMIQRFVVRRAHVVVAPSAYLKNIVSLWGAQAKIIYNGIEQPVTAELPTQRQSGFLVVSLGRRVPWKGFEAIEEVVGLEDGWQLVIGSDMERKQALGWAKAADVFVLNSSYEGLSHTLLEVMSLGTPIVATSVGGNPELIEDTVDGLLIPANDNEALHAALKKVQADKEGAQARAAAAQRKARQFSIERTIDELVVLLKSLCAS